MGDDRKAALPIPGAESNKLISAKDIATTATAVAGAAGQALLVDPASAASVLAMAGVLVALLPPLVGAATEASIRRLKGRADRFYAQLISDIAKDEEITLEEAAGRLETAKENENVSDAIWRAVRGLMEAPNDAAAVPLGVLVAEYTRNQQPADPYFRGVVRLLSELSAKEMSELLALLDWVLNTTKEPEVIICAYDWELVPKIHEYRANELGHAQGPQSPQFRQIPWTWEVQVERNDGHHPRLVDHHPDDGARLLSSLRTNGLAVDSGKTFWDRAPMHVKVHRTVIERLARLLRIQ